jgi:acetyltransferase-like isoleucine patch superfamily enzyme
MNFIDPTARLGAGTVVWHFAVVLADVVTGSRCSIGSHVEIGRGTQIGDETRIGNGVFLPPNSRIGARVFIGPGVVCTDDKFPRVNNSEYDARPPQIEDDATIGAGAVLLPGIRIGARAFVAAGAIVTHDVAADEAVRCQPARRVSTWSSRARHALRVHA